MKKEYDDFTTIDAGHASKDGMTLEEFGRLSQDQFGDKKFQVIGFAAMNITSENPHMPIMGGVPCFAKGVPEGKSPAPTLPIIAMMTGIAECLKRVASGDIHMTKHDLEGLGHGAQLLVVSLADARAKVWS